MKPFKEIITEIESNVEKPFITATFGDNWKEHAIKNYPLEIIVDIAWKNGRKAILLERALKDYTNEPFFVEQAKFAKDITSKYSYPEELKERFKPCPNHPDVLTSQCGICNGTFPKLEQPKTEEVERGWTITDAKEQPTSPSIEKMAELKKEFLYERHYYSGKETLWEFIEKVFQEGYKANNHLDELEKWVREERYHYGTDINSQELLNKIYQLKTNKVASLLIP